MLGGNDHYGTPDHGTPDHGTPDHGTPDHGAPGLAEGQPEAVVDLGAITANVAAMREHANGAQVMAVVKSDGYGHGMLPAATAALAGGAAWLGVARIGEALELRAAGLTAPVLALLGDPAAPHEAAVRAGIDITAGTPEVVAAAAAAARAAGQPARLQLEADTGMARGGATAAQWPDLVRAALRAQAAGEAVITGIWSHFACADIPGHPSVPLQLGAFQAMVAVAEQAGARPEVRHLANTAAALDVPGTCLDLVRCGGGIYGLSTRPGGAPGWLTPAMTVRARLIQAKRVPAGTPVSYGHRYTTTAETTLAVLPLGYHEGIPRLASGTAQVLIRGRRLAIAGTVNMNQVILDLGDLPAAAGDEVILFGPGTAGEPTAQDWADALGTVSYEIVTRFAGHIARSYQRVTSAQAQAHARVTGRTDGQSAEAHSGGPAGDSARDRDGRPARGPGGRETPGRPDPAAPRPGR
jgi:alanine racemase